MNDSLTSFIEARKLEFAQIPEARKSELRELAAFATNRRAANQIARLTFICTHNSRRSHLAQVWAQVAANHFGVDGVEAFSGGTEATAFNPRAISALQRAGFDITASNDPTNPRYQVRFADNVDPLECFSKVFSESPNPTSDFCAVMTCSDADEKCPLIQGAALRLPIKYEDPKVADDSAEETTKYDERCAQIAREMLFAFSQA